MRATIICCIFISFGVYITVQASELKLPKIPECGLMEKYPVEGSEVGIRDFPWLVYVKYDRSTKGNYACTGVLISEHHILTAYHCLDSAWLGLYFGPHIFIGEHKISTNPDCEDDICNDAYQLTHLQTYFRHPQYERNDGRARNNIALGFLGKTIEFSPSVQPICLPSAFVNFTEAEGVERLVVAGWGKPSTHADSDDVRSQVILPVLDRERCKILYKEKYNADLPEQEFCVGDGGKIQGCVGLMGAPLMKKIGNHWVLEGLLTDWQRCDEDFPLVVPKIAHYEDFIFANLQKRYG